MTVPPFDASISELESKIADRIRAGMLCNATCPKPAVVFSNKAEAPARRVRAVIEVELFTEIMVMPPPRQALPGHVEDRGTLIAPLVTSPAEALVNLAQAGSAIDVENFRTVPA